MKKQILIIDDEPDNIKIILDILKEHNYKVIIANSGENGFSVAKIALPDLIITDWEMPGLSGIETIKLLKKEKNLKDIPIIMATGKMMQPEDLKTALEAEAVDYIRKPIDPVELIARTQSILKIATYNKELIEYKNKELAENALFLIKNNRFNIALTKQLQNLHDNIPNLNNKTSKIFNKIIDEVEQKVKEDNWQRFELAFKSINNDFKKNLLKKFPMLTPAEIKLAIFLKLEMNTKDIAFALYITPESVKVSRYRLRKKLQLTADQNLQSFLSSF